MVWISPAVLIIAGVIGLVLAIVIVFIWRNKTLNQDEGAPGQKKHKKKGLIIAATITFVVIGGIGGYYAYADFIAGKAKPHLEVTHIIRESNPQERNTFTISGVTDPGCTLFVDGERQSIAQDGTFRFVKSLEPNTPGELIPIEFIVQSSAGVKTIQTHRVRYIDY